MSKVQPNQINSEADYLKWASQQSSEIQNLNVSNSRITKLLDTAFTNEHASSAGQQLVLQALSQRTNMVQLYSTAIKTIMDNARAIINNMRT